MHSSLIYDNISDLSDFSTQMTKHAMSAYLQFAAPHDFLHPSTKTGHSMYKYPMFLTLIDSLDTLFIMNLSHYHTAKHFVKHANLHQDQNISFFEMNIRVVGGLLGIYALDNDEMYLNKATKFADALLDTLNDTKIPYTFINIVGKTGHYPKWTHYNAILSEFTTFQLEYFQLSKLTNNPRYREYAESIYHLLFSIPLTYKGVYPSFFNPVNLTFINNHHYSIGAFGDSFYEYLLKYAILTNNVFYKYKFDEAILAIINYYTQYQTLPQSHIHDKFDHLTCFLGGVLALSAYKYPNHASATLHIHYAKEFTDYCWDHYIIQPTGLAPDTAFEYIAYGPWYKLRPELVESVFYLYAITKQPKYLKMNFIIMRRIQMFCYTPHGYMSVNVITANKRDPQDSWFIAETLKYLFLTFVSSSSDVVLDHYLLTTQGHFIPYT